LEYAKSLIKRKAGKHANSGDEEDEEAEESWTFIGGDEPDPDITTKRLSDMDTPSLRVEGKALGSKAITTGRVA
jgi:sterol 3beta-glucosyltransferase